MKVKPQIRQHLHKKATISTPTNFRSRKKTLMNRISPGNIAQNSSQIRSQGFLENEPILPRLPQVSSTSWCLYDATADKAVGFRENHVREVASLTKIMTTIVSLNLIEKYSMDKEVIVKVSKSAAQLNGTSAQLKFNTWIKVEDLLYGAMLPSGNDAAYLLAEVFGLLLFYQKMKPQEKEYQDIESIDICLYDSTQQFVNRFLKEMNRTAKALRMYRTSFANPHGLANVLNCSSSSDMLALSRYACANPNFRKIMNTQEYSSQYISDNLEDIVEVKEWKNTNKLLWKGWQGIKTGQTISAGSCLATIRDNVYIIVLNCNNIEARFEDTETIFNWYKGFVRK